MRCPACQTRLKRNTKTCSHCGETIKPGQRLKKLKQILPGFRTGKRYKKVLACFLYTFIGIVILAVLLGQPSTADESAKTIFLYYLMALVHVFFLILLPFLLCTNFMGIRNRLPLFKVKKRSKSILATCIIFILWLLIYPSCAQALSDAQFQSFSPEKQAAIRLANETRQKEAAMMAAAKVEEKALKEQQKQAKKSKQQEETENKNQQVQVDAQEKVKSKAEEKKRAKEEKALEKKQKAEEKKRVKEEKALEKQAKAEEKKKAKEEEKKQKALREEYNKIDKTYEDRDGDKLKSLAQTVSGDAYAYLIQKCQEDYQSLLNRYRSKLKAKDYSSLRAFRDAIQYLRLGFPELQQIEKVSQKAAEILERQETSNKLYSGSIKSESSLIYLDVYVDYRIKNSNFVQIAGYAVTDQYLDEYKISSYEYGYFGAQPSSDWEAILGSGDSIQEGVLQSWAISTTTKSYISGNGFKKSYMVYRLVSDQEVDAFYASLDKQKELQRQLQPLWKELQKLLS